jgi:hypothetical protein
MYLLALAYHLHVIHVSMSYRRPSRQVWQCQRRVSVASWRRWRCPTTTFDAPYPVSCIATCCISLIALQALIEAGVAVSGMSERCFF